MAIKRIFSNHLDTELIDLISTLVDLRLEEYFKDLSSESIIENISIDDLQEENIA